MSIAPMGPGWWQASDGMWYPPQPPPPPAMAPGPTGQWPAPAFPAPAFPAPALPGLAAPRPSRLLRVLVVLLVGAVLAGVGVYLGATLSGTSFAGQPAASVVQAALTAATQEGSMTLVQTATGTTNALHQQSTLDRGAQQFHAGPSSLQNVCVPGTCYVEGNAAGLQHGFLFSAAQAAAASGKWLSLPAGSSTPTLRKQYRTVLANTTLRSYLANFPHLSHPVNRGATTVTGQAVVEVTGTGTVAGTSGTGGRTVNVTATYGLYVAAAAPHTLVLVTESGRVGSSSRTVRTEYSHWGSTPAPKAPATSVPFATFMPRS